MKALVLEDVRRFEIREVAVPVPKANEVLVQVKAVGICGTDLHIFQGLANYNRDQRGQPIALRQHPQVLGHEFCGTVEVAGRDVKKCKPGDSVVVDQVLNCWSQGRTSMCEYCLSGDSHQCEFQQELGITGIPGGFVEYVAVTETNIVVLPPQLPADKAAITEPLGCVLHASSRMENAQNRYTFEGRRRIRYILIMGAGPSGLLFIQYLRKIKRFDGEILVADVRQSKLELVRKLGATPLHARKVDLITEVRRRTNGEGVHYLIEATGSGEVFDWIPSVIRRQATILIYGAGHSGRDIGVLTPFQVMENILVTSAGASGGFEKDGTPVTYLRSIEYIRDGQVDAESLISHRYSELSDLQKAFTEDFQQDNYIKGMLVRG